MPLLFLLLISMHLYIDAADDQPKSTVTVQMVDDQHQITYTRDDFAIKFPANLLFTSKVLENKLIFTGHINLKDDTHWLLDKQKKRNIPLIIKMLNACANHTDIFTSEQPDITATPTPPTEKQVALLVKLADFFMIDDLSTLLASHLIQHPAQLAALDNNYFEQEEFIKSHIDFKALGTFLYKHRQSSSYLNNTKKRNFLDFKTLEPQHQAIIKKHLPHSNKWHIEVNPTNTDLIMACNGSFSKKILILNTNTNLPHCIDIDYYSSNTFSPDGTKIISKIRGPDTLKVLNASNGESIFEGHGVANRAKNIIYGPKKNSDAWGFHLLDEKRDEKRFIPFSQNDKKFAYIKFSPDGKTFAARSNGCTFSTKNNRYQQCLELYDLDQCIEQNTNIKPISSLNFYFPYNGLYPFTQVTISYNNDGSNFLIYDQHGSTCTTFDTQSLKPLGKIKTNWPIQKACYIDNDKLKIMGYRDYSHKGLAVRIYDHIPFTTLPLPDIGTLYKAYEDWKRNQPHTIADKETLDRLSEIVPDLLDNPKLFALTQELVAKKSS